MPAADQSVECAGGIGKMFRCTAHFLGQRKEHVGQWRMIVLVEGQMPTEFYTQFRATRDE